MARRIALLLAMAFLVGACSLDAFMEAPHGVVIDNDLDEVVQVWYKDSARPSGQIDANRAETFAFDLTFEASASTCTTEDIVITSHEGRELARIPPPACIDRYFSVSQWLTP